MSKIKIIAVFFSYIFLIFLIVLSYNVIVPQDEIQDEIPEINNSSKLVEEIINDYRPNEDSVYEIIEKKDVNEVVEKNKKEENLEKKVQNKNEKKYKIQFASFQNKDKSKNVAMMLRNELSEFIDDSALEIKEFKHSSGKFFYRVLTAKTFSYQKAKNICKKINEKNIDCIITKDESTKKNT